MTADDWLPIDDAANPAPKDGTRFRLWANDMEWHVRWTSKWTGVSMGGWELDNSICVYPNSSSRWQPIVGPKQKREGE